MLQRYGTRGSTYIDNRQETRDDNSVRKDIFPLCIIAALTVALIAFYNAYGPVVGHSFTPNYSWVQAFTGQFLQGELYPRWLYQGYQGAGSPAFYFYGPLPFWVSSMARLVYCRSCTTEALLMIGPSILMGLASISCYYLVKSFTDRKTALVSSLLYFFLPYHFIIDLWIRNSWGELAAYIFTPLLLLTIKQSDSGKRYLVAAAIAYAGLLFSHLPSALLFSPVLLLYACLESGWIKGIQRIIFIVSMGMGLAAIYLLPALSTQELINVQYWTGHDPVNWLLFSGKLTISKGLVFVIVSVFSLLLIFLNSSLFSANDFRRDKLLLLALIASVYCLFMLTDLSFLLWKHFDLLNKVQFPWRITSILDLAIIIVFSLTLNRLRGNHFKYFSYISIVLIYIAGIYSLFSQDLAKLLLSSKDEPASELVLDGYESAEYRTRWLAHDYPGIDFRDLESIMSRTPVASIISGNGSIVDIQQSTGKLVLELDVETDVLVRFRRFYYPGWSLWNSDNTDEIFNIELSPYYALTESKLPAGRYSVTLSRFSSPEETLGAVISTISLLTCVLLLFLIYRNPGIERKWLP